MTGAVPSDADDTEDREGGPAGTAPGWSGARVWWVAAPVLVVAAVVATAATGSGLLVRGVGLDSGGWSVARSVGLAMIAAGLVAALVIRRRHHGGTDRDSVVAALLVAAVTMGLLALLAFPFSPSVSIDLDDRDGGTTSWDRPVTDMTGSHGAPVVGPDSGVTVAIDRATGEAVPAVVHPDGRVVAVDPETGATTELFAVQPGDVPRGDSGYALPVGYDPATGAYGIIGIVDRRTGEVGIIGPGGELRVLDDLEHVGTIDPGTHPDGVIDVGDVHAGDVDVTDIGGGRDVYRLLDDIDLDRLENVIGGGISGTTGTGDGDGAGSFDNSGGTAGGVDSANPAGGVDSPAGGVDSDSPADGDGSDSAADGGGRVLAWLVPVALLALAAALVMGLRGRPWQRARPHDPEQAEPPIDAERAEAGLAASLDEAADAGAPRSRIIAAYTRLLEALTAAGAPRHRHEAPHEHLNRVLGPLGVRPEPVHRLAELFVMAKFSEHPMTEEHREAALDALGTSLAELRATTGVHEPAAAATTSAP